MNNLPPEFWEAERARLMGLILPAVQKVASAGILSGAEKLAGLGLTVDGTVIHAAAAAWARGYTDDLLLKLQTTNQRVVGPILANWIETPGATMGDLVSALKPAFEGNTFRADLIAVTETTRAFAEGEALIYQEAGIGQVLYKPPAHPGCRCWSAVVRKSGKLYAVWKTNRDDVVCRQPLNTPWGRMNGCRALHNTVISAGELAGTKI